MLLQVTMDNIKENNYRVLDLPRNAEIMDVVNGLKIEYLNAEFAGEEMFKWLLHNPNSDKIPDRLKLKGCYFIFLGGIISGATLKHTGDLSMSAPVLEWDGNLFQFRGRGPSIPKSIDCKTVFWVHN